MERRLVTWNGFFAYFLIGFFAVLFAPALPVMIRDFGLTLTQAGLIFPAKSLGHVVAVLIGGVWSDRVGRKPMIIAGSALLGLGSLAVATGRSWPVVLTAFLIGSVGQGFVNASVNALVSESNPDRRGKALNMLHGVYGLGGFVGPLIAGSLILSDQSWRPVFLLAGVLWLVSGAITVALKFPEQEQRTQPKRSRFRWGGPLFIGLFFVAFLYNGTAWGLVGWINTYLEQKAGIMPAVLAAQMVALFYVALTTGRFLWSRVVDGLGYGRVILLCAIGPTIAFPFVVWGGNPWLVAAGVMISGLFFAGLYPTALAYATHRQPELAGTVSGTISMATAAGNMIVPWITGIIADAAGFEVGMTFIYVLVIALLGVAIAVSRTGEKMQEAA